MQALEVTHFHAYSHDGVALFWSEGGGYYIDDGVAVCEGEAVEREDEEACGEV